MMVPVLALIVALAVQQPPEAAAGDTIDQAAIAETPAQILAARMLGPGRTEGVVRFEARREPHLGHIDQVRFFRRPQPIDREFCGQPVESVGLTFAQPVDERIARDRLPLRVGAIGSSLQIALAPGCRLRAGQRFASINPDIDVRDTMKALRDFATALDHARASAPLPFEISCRSEWAECGTTEQDARRALAALSADQVWLVGTASTGEIQLSVAPGPGPVHRAGEPGQLSWQVHMSGFGTSAAKLAMTRRIPPPF